jgi:ATPase subunit of ABC transporter with duplicated ATPase domains
MLDEPTNHLDLDMLAWLESFLESYKGTLIVVSHDWYFLHRITNKIFDLSAGTLDAYRGNYSEFIVKREERLEAMRREYEKQQADRYPEIAAFAEHGDALHYRRQPVSVQSLLYADKKVSVKLYKSVHLYSPRKRFQNYYESLPLTFP